MLSIFFWCSVTQASCLCLSLCLRLHSFFAIRSIERQPLATTAPRAPRAAESTPKHLQQRQTDVLNILNILNILDILNILNILSRTAQNWTVQPPLMAFSSEPYNFTTIKQTLVFLPSHLSLVVTSNWPVYATARMVCCSVFSSCALLLTHLACASLTLTLSSTTHFFAISLNRKTTTCNHSTKSIPKHLQQPPTVLSSSKYSPTNK